MAAEIPPLTGRSQRVLNRAREEQARLGHPALTPEHVLYGILADPMCVALLVLRDIQVNTDPLTARVCQELERGAPETSLDEEAFLREAQRWASEPQPVDVGTEHLLLALLSGSSAAGKWLRDAGAGLEEAKAATARLTDIAPRLSGPGVRISGEESPET